MNHDDLMILFDLLPFKQIVYIPDYLIIELSYAYHLYLRKKFMSKYPSKNRFRPAIEISWSSLTKS